MLWNASEIQDYWRIRNNINSRNASLTWSRMLTFLWKHWGKSWKANQKKVFSNTKQNPACSVGIASAYWARLPVRAIFLYSTESISALSRELINLDWYLQKHIFCIFSLPWGGGGSFRCPCSQYELRFLRKPLRSVPGRMHPLICSLNMTPFLRTLPPVFQAH
jgi:hypothetical protein